MNKKLLAVIFLLPFLSGCFESYTIPRATVMITNVPGTGGGSGSIIQSSPTKSTVLTNSHVCEMAKGGAVVHSLAGEYLVTDFKQSKIHDLCLLHVAANLQAHVKVAQTPPSVLEEITVAGHPKLLPLILSRGHVSGKMLAPIAVGTRECTEEERQNPATGFFCTFIGRVPVIKIYEAQVLSATIQPGSSGSAVYNSNGEIVAVIFAGAGDFGYGLAVPHEYLADFLTRELDTLTTQRPNMFLGGSREPASNDVRETFKRIQELCSKITTEEQKKFCDNFGKSIKQPDTLVQ